MFYFRPQLLSALRGYERQRLVRDVAAGVTVGVVAMPLAMAFAIASGLPPETGLFTAIIAGFLISALGGTRVQIGGPAGAFIVIVAGIVQHYGVANLVIATAMSGVMLFAFGVFKLGTLVRFIPITVVIGFTNGIAVLIVLSQIKDFFGLQAASVPAHFFGMVSALAAAAHSIDATTSLLAFGSLLCLVLWQFVLPRWVKNPRLANLVALLPGSVIALVIATVLVAWFDLPVQTIGSKFGGIPSSLPAFQWPAFSWETVRFLLVPAATLAALGAIESLLCARIADGIVGDKHDPNQELMAQGIANFITPFFGGMPATGTIARTVTNIKAGASSPVAGMVHAGTLLLTMLVAAPLARHIPLATMAAILVYVAWNMGEWRALWTLRQFRLPYRITLLSVFFLTVVMDLTVAVEVGLIAACLTFIYRISNLTRCDRVNLADYGATPASTSAISTTTVETTTAPVAAYRLYGALFFGAVTLVEALQTQLPKQVLVLDMKNLIYMDSSGADVLLDLLRVCQHNQVQLLLCSLMHQPLDMAQRCGLLSSLGQTQLYPDLAHAIAAALSATDANTGQHRVATSLATL